MAKADFKKNNIYLTEAEVKFFKPVNMQIPGDHSLSMRLKQYLSNLVLMLIALALYKINKYYVDLFSTKALNILEIYVGSYAVVGFICYAFFLKRIKNETKGYVFLRTVEKFFRQANIYLREFTKNPQISGPSIDANEKTAVLFILVKLFYLPLMANFCVNNYNSFQTNLIKISSIDPSYILSINNFNQYIYPLLFNLFLFIDTLYFTFGYMFEADFLNNKVRSVEPTIFGWMVAILCYPPFNGLFGNYISWYATDYPSFKNTYATFVLRLIVISLFGIYLWATLALGTKSSNLTNRGTVSRGPYAFIRHPAYISKNLAWWISMIPVISIPAVINMSAWTLLYFLRAITEERHLIKDPEYQEYCKKVRYRFIPGVW